MDNQDRAFRNMSPKDVWKGSLDEIPGSVVHSPLTTESLDEIKLPDDWDNESWDQRRVGPKTIDEAKEALESRIDDPRAPDGEEVRGAYDELKTEVTR